MQRLLWKYMLMVKNEHTRPRPQQSIRPSSAALSIFQWWVQSAITHVKISPSQLQTQAARVKLVSNNQQNWPMLSANKIGQQISVICRAVISKFLSCKKIVW